MTSQPSDRYGPSQAAVDHASREAEPGSLEWNLLRRGVRESYDPALGLDRSVCLRDVIETLRSHPDADYEVAGFNREAADWLERLFGGRNA